MAGNTLCQCNANDPADDVEVDKKKGAETKGGVMLVALGDDLTVHQVHAPLGRTR